MHDSHRPSVARPLARLALGFMLLTLFTASVVHGFQHPRDSRALHKRRILNIRQGNETSTSESSGAGPTSETPPPPPTSTTDNPPPPPTTTPTPTPTPGGGGTGQPNPDPEVSSTTTPPGRISSTTTPSSTPSSTSQTPQRPTGTTTTPTGNLPTNTGTNTRTTLIATGASRSTTGSGTQSENAPSETNTSSGSGNILDNKSAAAGIFSVVGIAGAVLLIALGAWVYRKHQAARRAREADDDFGFGDDGSMRELNLRDSTPMPSGMEGAAGAGAAGAALGRTATQSTARRGGASSHGHESEDYYNNRGPLRVVTDRESSFDLIPPSSLPSAYDPTNANPFKRDSTQPGIAGRGAPAAAQAYATGYSAADYAQHYAQQDAQAAQQWQDDQRTGYDAEYGYDQSDYNAYNNQQYSRPAYTGGPASSNPFVQAEVTAMARGGEETNTDSVYGGQAITTDSVYYDSAVPLPSATGTDYHSAASHPGSVTPTQASAPSGEASSASLAQKPGMLPAIDFDHADNSATFEETYGDDLQTPKTPRTGAALLGPLRPASPDSFYGATPRGSMLPSPRE